MTLPPPQEFELTKANNATLAKEFTELAKDVNLDDVTSLKHRLPKDFCCYLWLLHYQGKHYKIYLGRTHSIKKRVNDYSSDFQLHSPNDFKLRYFYSLMSEWWPGSTLDLYVAACDEERVKARETHFIHQFKPLLINDRLTPSKAERTIVQNAYCEYYRSVISRKLRATND